MFLPIKRFICTLFALCISIGIANAQKSFNVASGDWNVAGNWSPVGVPAGTDAVTIPAGRSVTVVGTGNVCASIAFTAGATSSSVVFGSLAELAVTGNITMTDPTVASVSQTINIGDGTLTCAAITMANTSAVTEKNTINISTGNLTLSGNLTMNGGAVGENELIFSGAGKLTVGGTFGLGTNDTFTPSTSTVELNGAAAQTVSGAIIFNNFICSGAGLKTIQGTYNKFIIRSGATATLTNTTQVNDSTLVEGTIQFTSTTGTRTFAGPIKITGSWTNTINEAITVRNGIINNGTFSSGTGLYTFNTNNQSLSGNTMTFSGAVTVSSPTVITNVDSVIIVGTFTVASGAGWTNSANSKLRLDGGTTFTGATLNFSAAPNTLHFNSAAAQSLLANTTCYFLKKSAAGTLTLGTNITINNRINIDAGVIACGASAIDLNGNLHGVGTLTQAAGGNFRISGENLHTGTFTPSTGTFTYDGADQTIRIVNYGNLAIDGTGTKTFTGTLTVAVNLILTASTLDCGANTVDINGSLSGAGTLTQGAAGSILLFVNNTHTGTFNPGTSTFTYDGAAQTVRGTTYNNLTIAGSNTKTIAAATNINGNLTLTAGTLACGANTVTLTGNLSGAGVLTQTAGGNFNIAGNNAHTGTFTPSTATFRYNGDVQTLRNTTYYNLVIDGTGTKTYTGTITVTATTTLTAGTLDCGANILDMNGNLTGAGTLTQGAAGSILLFGNNTHSGTFNPGTSTFTYDGAAQTVRATTYNNLTIGGTVTKTLAGNVNVNGNLVLSAATLAAGANTLTITGNLSGAGALSQAAGGQINLAGNNTSTGTFTPSTGTFAYNGAAQTLRNTTYYILIIDGSGAKTFTGTLTVSNTLILTAGSLDCATNTLDVNGQILGSGTLTQTTGSILLSGSNNFTGTFTAGTGTFNYDGASQTIAGLTYNNLTISGSGTKTLAANTNVGGTLTLTAGNLAIGGFTLTLSGTVAGTTFIEGSTSSNLVINGTAANPSIRMLQTSSATRSLNDFTMSRTTGATLANAMELNGTLSISNGTLASAGFLTVVSNASSTGRIASITSGGISGNITFQRFIPGGANKRKWRFISSPINTSGNIAFSQIIDDVMVTGTGGATNGFDACSFCSPSLRTYTESTAGLASVGWTNPTNISNTINTGFAFELFVRGDRVQPNPFLLNTIPNDVVIDFIGTTNSGNITTTLSYTNNSEPNADGFNLVGNPYPSQIDWQSGSITKTNIENKFWAYSAVNGSYGVWDGDLAIGTNSVTNIIPVGQGYFVHATTGPASIAYTETVKSASPAFNYFKNAQSSQPIVKLKASNAYQADELIIHFDTNAHHTFGDKHDALKFFSDKLNFYSKSSDNVNATINSIEYPNSINSIDTLNLSLFSNNDSTVEYTEHSIEVLEFRNLIHKLDIYLVDHYANKTIDLKQQQRYTFTIDQNTASYGNSRFDIVFKRTTTGQDLKESLKNVQLYPNPSNKVCHLVFDNPTSEFADVDIVDLSGRVVERFHVQVQDNHAELLLDTISTGTYIVRIQMQNDVYVKKLLVQKEY